MSLHETELVDEMTIFGVSYEFQMMSEFLHGWLFHLGEVVS